MSAPLQVVPLTRRPQDVLRFLRVSYPIYRDDPRWVAPLLFDLQKVFSDRNPLFEHAEMRLWVATRGGQDVGRIAGIIDQNYIQTQKEEAAFFGFFECVNEPAVAQRLFEAVYAWARDQKLGKVLGPMNPTTNDECGLLVDGFDRSPVFMMPYNPPYYAALIAAEGFRKAKDLLAFYIDLTHSPMERLNRIAEKTRRRNPELVFRPVRRRTLNADLAKIKEVYNEAWEANWGFVPMTGAEIDFMAGRLKPLLVEGLVWLAEHAGEPVGFLLGLPDFNQALKPLRGRLCTFALLGFLPYVLGWKMPTVGRCMILGVKHGYRGRGLEAVMLAEGLKVGAQIGFCEAEASWILEDNLKTRGMVELFGGKAYKTYRLFQRDL